MRILLIGGGKSGKSTMAQRLAAALSGDMPRYYWATMTPHDDEDLARIRRHVADRAGMDFITVERSFDLHDFFAESLVIGDFERRSGFRIRLERP